MPVSEGDDPPSGAGPRADPLTEGPPAPVTVGAMEGDSDMEISDDDRPLPSSGGSCLQTQPPPHQAAHDFLSSLLLAPDGEGMWPGDEPVDEEGAGVCPGALTVHARPALGPADPIENPAAAPHPGGVGAGGTLTRRQKRNQRKSAKRLQRRAFETATSFLDPGV